MVSEFETLVLNSIHLIEWLNLTLLLCCIRKVVLPNWYAVSCDPISVVLDVFHVVCNVFVKIHIFCFILFSLLE